MCLRIDNPLAKDWLSPKDSIKLDKMTIFEILQCWLQLPHLKSSGAMAVQIKVSHRATENNAKPAKQVRCFWSCFAIFGAVLSVLLKLLAWAFSTHRFSSRENKSQLIKRQCHFMRFTITAIFKGKNECLRIIAELPRWFTCEGVSKQVYSKTCFINCWTYKDAV